MAESLPSSDLEISTEEKYGSSKSEQKILIYPPIEDARKKILTVTNVSI